MYQDLGMVPEGHSQILDAIFQWQNLLTKKLMSEPANRLDLRARDHQRRSDKY